MIRGPRVRAFPIAFISRTLCVRIRALARSSIAVRVACVRVYYLHTMCNVRCDPAHTRTHTHTHVHKCISMIYARRGTVVSRRVRRVNVFKPGPYRSYRRADRPGGQSVDRTVRPSERSASGPHPFRATISMPYLTPKRPDRPRADACVCECECACTGPIRLCTSEYAIAVR